MHFFMNDPTIVFTTLLLCFYKWMKWLIRMVKSFYILLNNKSYKKVYQSSCLPNILCGMVYIPLFIINHQQKKNQQFKMTLFAQKCKEYLVFLNTFNVKSYVSGYFISLFSTLSPYLISSTFETSNLYM